ncbi:MAG: molecular chaperone [Deferribacterales bacterium]|jgi:TorA maturation chaperone TorD
MQALEMQNIFAGRSVAYNVFSRVFIDTSDAEADAFYAETFELMLEIAESSENENMIKGAAMLRDFMGVKFSITDILDETRDERAKEYTRLFILGKISVPIYESVYTSPQHLTKQESWEQVKAFFTSHFFKRAQEDRTMEDHLAMELQFVGRMSSKAAAYMEANNFDDAEEAIVAQLEFLNKHISRWAFLFCDKVASAEKDLSTKFYPAFALMLKGFLEDDMIFLSEITE